MLLLFAIVVLLNTVSDQCCWKRRKMWHNSNSFVGSSLLIWDNASKKMKNNSSRLNSWLTNWKCIGSCYELQLKKKKNNYFLVWRWKLIFFGVTNGSATQFVIMLMIECHSLHNKFFLWKSETPWHAAVSGLTLFLMFIHTLLLSLRLSWGEWGQSWRCDLAYG